MFPKTKQKSLKIVSIERKPSREMAALMKIEFLKKKYQKVSHRKNPTTGILWKGYLSNVFH